MPQRTWSTSPPPCTCINSRRASAGARYNFGRTLYEDLQRIGEPIARVETSLLTEFPKWASTLEMRVRSPATVLRALDLELDAATERLTKLEDRPS